MTIWNDDEEFNFQSEDQLKLQLEAQKIPDRSIVTKRTGNQEYVLRKNISVYSDQKAEKPTIIQGLFLIGVRGDINQVAPDLVLCWVVKAEELYDMLEHDLDSDPDDDK